MKQRTIDYLLKRSQSILVKKDSQTNLGEFIDHKQNRKLDKAKQEAKDNKLICK